MGTADESRSRQCVAHGQKRRCFAKREGNDLALGYGSFKRCRLLFSKGLHIRCSFLLNMSLPRAAPQFPAAGVAPVATISASSAAPNRTMNASNAAQGAHSRQRPHHDNPPTLALTTVPMTGIVRVVRVLETTWPAGPATTRPHSPRARLLGALQRGWDGNPLRDRRP